MKLTIHFGVPHLWKPTFGFWTLLFSSTHRFHPLASLASGTGEDGADIQPRQGLRWRSMNLTQKNWDLICRGLIIAMLVYNEVNYGRIGRYIAVLHRVYEPNTTAWHHLVPF